MTDKLFIIVVLGVFLGTVWVLTGKAVSENSNSGLNKVGFLLIILALLSAFLVSNPGSFESLSEFF